MNIIGIVESIMQGIERNVRLGQEDTQPETMEGNENAGLVFVDGFMRYMVLNVPVVVKMNQHS